MVLIVTGLPRTGTQWAAVSRTTDGAPTTHEGAPFDVWDDRYQCDTAQVVGDVSAWNAAPFTWRLVDAGYTVVGLRRRFGPWQRSMRRFNPDFVDGRVPWVAAAAHWSGISPEADPGVRAAAMYLAWGQHMRSVSRWVDTGDVPGLRAATGAGADVGVVHASTETGTWWQPPPRRLLSQVLSTERWLFNG